jgi:hypothetical protein
MTEHYTPETLEKGAGACTVCRKGEHVKCWGFIGTMADHPDGLPRCTCCHPNFRAARLREGGDGRG